MTVIFEKNEKELNKAIGKAKQYSKTQNYLIEEYVQGQLYSHSAFVIGGEIMIDFFVEEHCVVNKYVVDTSRVLYDFNESIKKQIRDDITLLANSLGLVDGLIHTQFVCDGKSFWLIEVTRRCPGDLYSKLIEFSTGFPYAEFYARPFINEIKQDQKFQLTNELVFRHTITSNAKMFFNSIEFNQEVKIIKYVPLSLTGDEIKESPFSRIGILFAKTDSETDFSELYKKTISREFYSLS
jgi:carbamoylphosphate synthase large subunit